jgi:poly(hydroxyalkanoate) depolymerase family esterase
MFDHLGPAMRRALEAVRASDPVKATRLLQDALSSAPKGEGAPLAIKEHRLSPPSGAATARMSLGETLASLRSGLDLQLRPTRAPSLPEGSAFLKRSINTHAGSREYRLFVPSSATPRGLLVMLHGCKQNAEDFAIGTAMNLVAETEGVLVAYPTQARTANPPGCWNWFRPEDQQRDTGEPHIIAEMTRALIAEYLPGQRVFVAGLSAGGAMAAVMGAIYPDLYEAIGIHSGLPYRSARDVSTAMAAMRGEVGTNAGHATSAPSSTFPRQILFHGGDDRVVVPANAMALMEAARRSHPSAQALERCFTSGSREVKHKELVSQDGTVQAEAWLVEGAGHYWSGGDPQGSYAKREGPNASREMMRFFLGRRLHI